MSIISARPKSVARFRFGPSLNFRAGRYRLAGRVTKFGRQYCRLPLTHWDRVIIVASP
jgi:hypothetical protein